MKARVITSSQFGCFRTAHFCLDGMHVSLVDDFGIAMGTKRTVKACDGSCKDSTEEIEMDEESTRYYRSILEAGGNEKPRFNLPDF